MKTGLDNKVFVFLGGIVDAILISILWYIGSIPVFTLGASSAALYYTVHKSIFRSEGYLFSTFKRSFVENFKKGTIIWLICLLADAFLLCDLILARSAIDRGGILSLFYYPILVCIPLVFMWQLSIFAYQARFEDSIRAVFCKSALIAFRNIGWMIFLTVIFVTLIYLCRYLIILTVVAPGGYTCLMHHVFEHIYEKTGWISKEDENFAELLYFPPNTYEGNDINNGQQ
ncbi:MAG: YesL family protein [Lachnospiraceae bacterium]|nr:YesL family protein [Lachnospiraceae bacterium]